MSTRTDWTCLCRAVNSPSAAYCEACGSERPDRPRALSIAPPHVPETQRPAKPPTFTAPTAAEDVLIRAEMAKIRALFGGSGSKSTSGAAHVVRESDAPGPASVGAILRTSKLGLPAILPQVRADLDRRSRA